MSMTKASLTEVARVAAEVQALIDGVIAETDNRGIYQEIEATGRYGYVPYPRGIAPGHAKPEGGKTTAALRRRSMDLTRLLADLRR